MNRLFSASLPLVLLPVFFVACKKEGDFSVPAGDSTAVTIVRPTCRLNAEGSDMTSGKANQYSLSYDDAGHLVSVLGTLSPSPTIVTNTTVSSTQIDENLDGVGGIQTFTFNLDVYSGLPNSYSLVHHGGGLIDQSISVHYDDSNRVTAVVAFRLDNHDFMQETDITYDKFGNASSLSTVAGTGTSAITNTWKVTAFDGKHSPYDSLKSQLLQYNWEFFFGSPVTIIQHLSPQNPVSCSFEGTGSAAISIEYQYNGNGYPTSSKQTTTSGGGIPTAIVNSTYTYVCK